MGRQDFDLQEWGENYVKLSIASNIPNQRFTTIKQEPLEPGRHTYETNLPKEYSQNVGDQ